MKSPVSKNITANGQSIVFDVRKLNTIKFMPKGTFAGVNVAFEASLDYGLTWVGIQVVRSNANTVEATSGVLSAAPAYNYRADVSGYTDFRIRSTAYTSGTQVWVLVGSVDQSDPIQPTASTVVTLGAGTAAAGTVSPPVGINHSVLAAATTNATSVKNAAGNLFEVTIVNYSAASRSVKFYEKTSAPVVGTDLPILTLTVNPTTTQTFIFGTLGKRFGTGIAYAMTQGMSAADAVALAAGDVRLSLTYV